MYHTSIKTDIMFARTIAPMGILILLLSFSAAQTLQGQGWDVSSPDKKVKVTIAKSGNRLSYSVSYANTSAIESSPLGIARDDQQFSENLRFITKTAAAIDETYTLSVGRKLQCRNQANEVVLTFENENNESVQLIFRAYNDGMAYRYRFPESDNTPTGSSARNLVLPSQKMLKRGYSRMI